MGDMLRFNSSSSFHHSGIFLGYLTAILLVVGTCTQSRAEDNSVSITIEGPVLTQPELEKQYHEIRELILDSFIDALWLLDFEAIEDSDQAKFSIDLELRGPYKECYWMVGCRWSENSSDKKHKKKRCWRPAALTIGYCEASIFDDLKQISCLGEIVNFTAQDPPKLRKNLCETNKDEGYELVYTTCFSVEIVDTIWNERIGITADKLPMQIESELDHEFKKLYGYNLFPEDCDTDTTRPSNIDFEIRGWIQETPGSKINVQLIVDDKEESSQTSKRIGQIKGHTQAIKREDHRKLLDSIIDHFRMRLKNRD